jgi:CDP-diacylglycerol---glycerol-3-phosphate 3-phosphatidyltransferase
MKPKNKQKIKLIRQEIKKEVLFNVPNSLTLLRLILCFFAVYMLFSNYSRISVASVFAIAAFTDFLDGYFARKLKQTTDIGARLDQVIDRVFTITIVVAIMIYFILNKNGKIILLFLVLSREIIGLPGFLVRIVRNKDTYKVKYIGKLTTFIQSVAIILIIAGFNWAIYLAIVTSFAGIIAGFDYLKDSFD